ncbi:MAG: DegT/DnrJ/EryC1/StrS family aminotransferase [Acidobacteriota bacterium]|nr:DegT/DnrJ/EryC1/StrS family aminotransferase [Acidobacteriota bacterium]MDQ5873495.1 DegT/DnrJ/EryC1/StrS family aminotransferase [Acidobacteriota bacterium]
MAAPAPVPILDLTRYDDDLKRDVSTRVAEIFSSGRFIMGAVNEEFERKFADEVGVRHALGVSSGTDALLVALMALGVGPGDEVVTSPFSFFASAGVIARLHARPVFSDIEPTTYNLDPDRLGAAITPRTKAVMPVHLYGQSADMDPITEVAGKVPVVEDACQAVGATYRGRNVGTIGKMAAFSFYPTKNLGAAGDAGAVTTDDDELATLLANLRLHGETERYRHSRVGGNFRLDSLQAAVLTAKLPRLADWTARRITIADRYGELLWDADLAGRVTVPFVAPGRKHVFHQYVVRVRDRDRVRAKLTEAGVGTAVFYPIPLHLQECFADLGYREGDFPKAEEAAREVLALPMFPQITDDEIVRVAEAVIASTR